MKLIKKKHPPAVTDKSTDELKEEISSLRKLNEDLKLSYEELFNNNKKLQQESFVWKSIVESIADEVWISDDKGNLSLINVPVNSYLGLNKFNNVPIEQLFNEIEVLEIDGKLRPMEESPLIRSLKGETLIGEEIMRHKTTGISRYRQYSSAPTKDSQGNITGSVAVIRDKTEVKSMEIALQESNERFDNVLNMLPDSFFIFDSEWRYVYLNDIAASRFKKPKSEILGLVVWDFVPGIRETERYKLCLQVATDKKPRVFLDYSDVVKRWYEYLVFPWKDGIATIMRDITDKKLAEKEKDEALAVAEEGRNTLNALMQYIPMGITIADAPDVNIRMVSRHGQNILEKTESEIAYIPAPEHVSVWGIYQADGVTPGTPEELPLTRATVSGEIVINEEWVVTRKDGTLVPILCNAAPIRDNKGRVVGGVIGWQDITDRKIVENRLRESEQKLRESEERFRLALDYSPVAVYTQDCDLKYTWIYQSIFSISNDYFIGKTDMDLYPLEQAEKLQKIKQQVIETGKPVREKVSLFVNGKEYHFDISVEPIFDNNNRISGIACAKVNITDLVRLEEEKNRQEVAQLIERSARLASVGVIAGGITHEINQPLNGIRMGVDGILFSNKKNKEVLPQIFIEMLQGISDGVKRIDEIIRSMRSFWMHIGNDTIEPIDLNKTIQTVLSFNTHKLSNHNISVDLKLHPNSLIVSSNELQIELVLSNLLNNALYALDKANNMNKTISFITYSKDGKAVVEIQDNGIGLPDVPEDKLYDPFFTTKPPTEGSGLGLAIAKMFLDKYGASIAAYNNEHGGATFKLLFDFVQKK